MASGWGPAEGVNDQIEQTIKDRIAAARKLTEVPGKRDCEDCGEPIPKKRRQAVPSAIRCIKCQGIFEGSR